MRIRFAHIADVHLGNQQYGLPERFDDFGRAWLDAIDHAITREVALVVIAGDLFEQRRVEPRALLQAIEGLRRLRAANIPALAVEGNHDRALYREGFSWMEFLDAEGYLKLLNPCVPGQPGCHYRPWKPGEGGSYVDVGGARIIGQPYLGASAGRAIEEMTSHLRLEGRGAAQYLIYVCHAGVEDIVPRLSGGLTGEDLDRLRPHVDYLALGHAHISFKRDGWLFNPGALETCRSDEADQQSGFFYVEVDTETEEKHRAELISNWRRHFLRLSFSMEDIASPDALAVALPTFLREKITPTDDLPIVELRLTGILRFEPSRLDRDILQEKVQQVCDSLHVEIKIMGCPEHEQANGHGAEHSREVVEKQVLTGIFASEADYREYANEWAGLAIHVKETVQQLDYDPQALIDEITQIAEELNALPDTQKETENAHL